jgi:hypothetical protein
LIVAGEGSRVIRKFCISHLFQQTTIAFPQMRRLRF